MKLVTAIVRPERVAAVSAALERAGVNGLTVSQASGAMMMKKTAIRAQDVRQPTALAISDITGASTRPAPADPRV